MQEVRVQSPQLPLPEGYDSAPPVPSDSAPLVPLPSRTAAASAWAAARSAYSCACFASFAILGSSGSNWLASWAMLAAAWEALAEQRAAQASWLLPSAVRSAWPVRAVSSKAVLAATWLNWAACRAQSAMNDGVQGVAGAGSPGGPAVPSARRTAGGG